MDSSAADSATSGPDPRSGPPSDSTLSLWVAGARPRTLPAAIAPVLAGTGAAVIADGFVWWKALLALAVSLSLQIGVNYANDYSDGIKGTDAVRIGPLRLVGSGAMSAASVKSAAIGFLALGAVFGLVLAATTSWWLLLVGAASIAAAWTYTGSANPYGYRALGEVSVFVFFGLVAVVGTTYVQLEAITWTSILAGVGVGALACAILVTNNLRDLPNDSQVGKRTLAVVLGDRRTRSFFNVLMLTSVVCAVLIAVIASWWAVLALAALPLLWRAARVVADDATGVALLPALRDTGLAELVWALGLTVGLILGSS